MILAVITQLEDCIRLATIHAHCILIEVLDRFELVFIDLDRQVIELSHSLDFEIVSPALVLTILDYVVFDVRVAILVDKGCKVLALQVDVVHAFLAYKLVLAIVAIHLISHSTIQTITIILNSDNPQSCLILHFISVFSLFVFVLDLSQLVSLES